jgi:hypothetical protein
VVQDRKILIFYQITKRTTRAPLQRAVRVLFIEMLSAKSNYFSAACAAARRLAPLPILAVCTAKIWSFIPRWVCWVFFNPSVTLRRLAPLPKVAVCTAAGSACTQN